MDKEKLVKVLNEIWEDFSIDKLYKFEYKGTDKKGRNKYKIRYISKFIPNCYIDETIIENESEE